MNIGAFLKCWRWVLLGGSLGLAGCAAPTANDGNGNANGISGNVKYPGVYTTIAVPGHPLEMPGSSYQSWRSFGPGETPAAIVCGYGTRVGDVNYSQHFDLSLIESASGTVVETFPGQVYEGRAHWIDLPIRKSGNYRLQLSMDSAVVDTWDFSVKRNDDEAGSADSAAAASAPYGKGQFGVSFANYHPVEAFLKYDDGLMWSLNRAVFLESRRSDRDDFGQIFAQRPAGHVTIEFDLSADGAIAAPRITENSMADAVGQFFLEALEHGAPYKPWPADARAALGADTRHLTVTFHYE